MPQIVQVFRSREGLSALLEFFEGAEPIEGTRVVRVGTPTEFKDALDDAGTRPVVCMFAGAKDLGARVLLPVYHRLPAADEFDSLEFLRVEVATDDGLAQAVCEEAFVAKTCPTPSDSNSSKQRCTALPLLITTPLLLLPLQAATRGSRRSTPPPSRRPVATARPPCAAATSPSPRSCSR